MKKFVVVQKETGELGLIIRLNAFDKVDDEPLCSLEGYAIKMFHESECDIYAMHSGSDTAEGPWLLIERKYVDEKCEIIGEL